MSSVLK